GHAVWDGGWEKWAAEGRPISTEPATYPPARFMARPRPDLIATREEVLAKIADQGASTINALSAEQHTGDGGISYGRAGRIAGSVNVAFARPHSLTPRTFLPPAELRELI